jgi:phosphate transporter
VLNGAADDPDKFFTNLLDAELERVTSFYQLKEVEIYDELDALIKAESAYEQEQDELDLEQQQNAPLGKQTRSTSIFKQIGLQRERTTSTASGRSTGDGLEEDNDESDDDANETSQLRPARRRPHADDDAHSTGFASSKRRTSAAFEDYNDMAFSALYDEGVSLKKRIVSVYVTLCELRSFIQLNKTGFEKVLKKFDKILDRKLKSQYLKTYVYPAYPFQQTTMDKLSENLSKVERAYSQICTKGDVGEAKRELRLHLREHVVWERNTVWREMIGIERKAQAANIGITQTLLGRDVNSGQVRRQGDALDSEHKEVNTPIGRYRCPQWLLSRTFWTLIFCIALFVALLVVPIMEKPEQQNCLAMVIFVSSLWATEVRLPFATRLITLTTTVNSAVCHITSRAIPGCHSYCCTKRRRAAQTTRFQGSSRLHLFRHVDTRYHAAPRRLHHRSCTFQVQYC